MSVPAAYLGVILIWATTPLAIKWSSEGTGFLLAVSARMVLGALLCLAALKLLGTALPWHRGARRTYLAAGMGIYGAMLCVYWAALSIPSGLISVLFGLTPLVTGAMAVLWLDEPAFTGTRVLGNVLGILGLVLIFGTGAAATPQSALGIAAVLAAVFLHSASTVWVKRIGADIPAMALAGGGLLVAAPAYVLTWLVFDGSWPAALQPRAWGAIVYLGVVGSVLGFFLYFYVLKQVAASRVALVTLITPVLALVVGRLFNDEVPGPGVWAGTALILTGLALHQSGMSWRGAARRAPARRG